MQPEESYNRFDGRQIEDIDNGGWGGGGDVGDVGDGFDGKSEDGKGLLERDRMERLGNWRSSFTKQFFSPRFIRVVLFS